MRTRRGDVLGAVVAIDPGPMPEAGEDLGRVLAAHLATKLEEMGARPRVLRADLDAGASERARAANALDAEVCISFRVAAERPGVTICSYFGTATAHSPMGRQLAEIIVEQLAGADAPGGKTEAMTVAVLRETRMPAVQIEPEDPISDAEGFAAAIATAVARYLEG